MVEYFLKLGFIHANVHTEGPKGLSRAQPPTPDSAFPKEHVVLKLKDKEPTELDLQQLLMS